MMVTHAEIAQWADTLLTIANEAGDRILEFYKTDVETEIKEDNSPVTQADLAAHQVIARGLKILTPDIPVVSEEDEHPDVSDHTYFWLVDPLDGTKSFLRHEGEFTVNIALIEKDTPVLGVVTVPAQALAYWGGCDLGAFRQRQGEQAEAIAVRTPDPYGWDVVTSKLHRSPDMEAFLKDYPVRTTVSASSSLKFCVVAEGGADLYPRLGRTMEWDTAAGQAVLMAAGGRVETLDGKSFTYGKPIFENPHFVAFGGKA